MKNRIESNRSVRVAPWTVGMLIAAVPLLGAAQAFEVEESTIEDVQKAIQSGETTCAEVVQAYVDRARAYNGVCTRLVTADGKPVSPGAGTVRAGAPLEFPSETVAVSEILPHFSAYEGLPIEFGRMEATQSDADVVQQYGMVVGIPDAGQVNALSTLNLRGERSVTCQLECDMHPSKGALPAHRRDADVLRRDVVQAGEHTTIRLRDAASASRRLAPRSADPGNSSRSRKNGKSLRGMSSHAREWSTPRLGSR
jgi:hypothetical protein